MHTGSARDIQTGALCFTAEKKVIQISELISSQELKTLPTTTNSPQPYRCATATTTLLEVPTFVSNFIFRNKNFKTFIIPVTRSKSRTIHTSKHTHFNI
jgi:hypothetical protein